ncbi:MAG TPA: hemolysin family protein [Candidatus Nanoarchaeia archaeon]|nr:hemolysin family protein [Candidatus Nanoarchaeia archaeon]
MITYTKLAFLFALIVLSAFSAMSEAALLSINRFKIKHWVEKKKIGAVYVQKLKNNPARLLTTLLIANNLANAAAAALITSMALEVFQNNALAIATGIATFLILVFGDILPKSIGVNNNELLAPLMAPAVWYLSYAFSPLIKMLEYAINTINRLFGTKKIAIISREELKSMVKYSEEQGSIKGMEKKMIHRIFDFENTTISDVMTLKKNIVSVGSEMAVKDVLSLPSAKMYSRFPVYEKHKDNIVGILYLKDMMKYVRDNSLDTPVKQVMRKPFFVFSHRKIDAMLKMFQGRKEHMAVVIDDKAQVVGAVTIENILEEIVGEIIDESDRINPSIHQISKNEWLANGTADIEIVNAKTGLLIKESDYDSLHSFIVATLGRPPKLAEEFSYLNFKFIIEDVQGKKVLKARIIKV